MKILFNVMLILIVSGCAGGKTKTQDQMYADAIAQPEIMAQFIAAQEISAKERAISEAKEQDRVLKLQAEIQAKEDTRKKSEAEKKQAETERRDAQDRQDKADKEARLAELEAEHQKTKPKCLNIKFTGITTPASPDSSAYAMAIRESKWDAMGIVGSKLVFKNRKYANEIEYVLASPDIEDTLARNPIQCNYSDGFFSSCKGFAYFKNHKATILNWDKDLYYVGAAVDFNSGRKNVGLAVRRKDARCAK